MGQSQGKIAKSDRLKSTVFQTPLGWWGTVGKGQTLARSYCGFPTKTGLIDAIRKENSQDDGFEEADWFAGLRQRLERFAQGVPDSFSDIELLQPELTAFQKKVVAVTRKIPIGKTFTYGELAAKAGYPRAARAVGTVMSSNRFPIIVPCHRVVASGGGLGGYTNPVGVSLKVQLLQLEAEMV